MFLYGSVLIWNEILKVWPLLKKKTIFCDKIFYSWIAIVLSSQKLAKINDNSIIIRLWDCCWKRKLFILIRLFLLSIHHCVKFTKACKNNWQFDHHKTGRCFNDSTIEDVVKSQPKYLGVGVGSLLLAESWNNIDEPTVFGRSSSFSYPASTFRVWPRTRPARAREPRTLPPLSGTSTARFSWTATRSNLRTQSQGDGRWHIGGIRRTIWTRGSGSRSNGEQTYCRKQHFNKTPKSLITSICNFFYFFLQKDVLVQNAKNLFFSIEQLFLLKMWTIFE